MLSLPEIEAAIAAEAAAHAEAAADLNPFGEAEARELGRARLVYSGAYAPVHGVYGLGLDGPVENRDWEEIERFFAKKERAPHFWLTPFTEPSVSAHLVSTHRLILRQNVRGWLTLPPATETGPHDPYLNGPDHAAWCLAFTRARNPAANEPDLLALTKLHQKNTRFYLEGEAASYTFFHSGVALVPSAHPALLDAQKKDAIAFRSSAFVVMGEGIAAPELYERILHEPV
jgi:hypothetical protein